MAVVALAALQSADPVARAQDPRSGCVNAPGGTNPSAVVVDLTAVAPRPDKETRRRLAGKIAGQPDRAKPKAILTRLRPGPGNPPAPGSLPSVPASSVRFLDLVTAIDATFTFRLQRALKDDETGGLALPLAEPSITSWENSILITGNVFASFSTNGGESFRFLNPATIFPAGDGASTYVIDQSALSDPRHRLVFWLMEYGEPPGQRKLRLVVARFEDLADPARARFHWYDLRPRDVEDPKECWFDFPDMVLGENDLYITANVFSEIDFVHAVAMRIPLAELAGFGKLTFGHSKTDFGNLRGASGAGDPMVFGTHQGESALRLYTWAEADSRAREELVPINRWSMAMETERGAAPISPDGRDWMRMNHGRISAAWVVGDRIGFAWTAGQDAQYPLPHVRVALMDRKTKRLVAQPVLWSDRYAFGYPAIAPNREGQLGVSVTVGGRDLYPSQVVGRFYPPDNSGAGRWELIGTARGGRGPSMDRWGDYFTIRPYPTLGDAWVATGVTLPAHREGEGDARTDVRFYIFEVVKKDH
jgi:hypothetical protein